MSECFPDGFPDLRNCGDCDGFGVSFSTIVGGWLPCGDCCGTGMVPKEEDDGDT